MMGGYGSMMGLTWLFWALLILGIVLLAVLAVYGMWQNYAGTDDVAATFGAQGIASYAIIFLWGFSSQIVASTLQTLRFDRRPV